VAGRQGFRVKIGFGLHAGWAIEGATIRPRRLVHFHASLFVLYRESLMKCTQGGMRS
jgi:hypothetical protein